MWWNRCPVLLSLCDLLCCLRSLLSTRSGAAKVQGQSGLLVRPPWHMAYMEATPPSQASHACVPTTVEFGRCSPQQLTQGQRLLSTKGCPSVVRCISRHCALGVRRNDHSGTEKVCALHRQSKTNTESGGYPSSGHHCPISSAKMQYFKHFPCEQGKTICVRKANMRRQEKSGGQGRCVQCAYITQGQRELCELEKHPV